MAMQVTETSAQGLKRDFKVVVPAADLVAKLESQLSEMKDKGPINGFRRARCRRHIRRLYGKSIMGDVVQEAVNEANRKIVDDNKAASRRLAQVRHRRRPGRDGTGAGSQGDLAFTVAVETLPAFEVGSFDDVAVERIVVDVADADVEEAIQRMPTSSAFTDRGATRPADRQWRQGDDRLRRQARTASPSRAARARASTWCRLRQLHPGFEEQLGGLKEGRKQDDFRDLPENYAAARLAGQEATFDVTVKNVAAPGDSPSTTNSPRSSASIRSTPFRAAVRSTSRPTRPRRPMMHTKRAAARRARRPLPFELPQGLVETRFDGIWRSILNEQAAWRKDLRARARRKKRRARNTAASPSAACVSASSWPRSARSRREGRGTTRSPRP